MTFVSISFIYYFLPMLFLIYFAVPNKYRNVVLLAASQLFYFSKEPSYLVLLLFAIANAYINGLLIEKYRGLKITRAILVSSIIINLLMLGIYKYGDFFIGNINTIFSTSIALTRLPLPMGISLYTFLTMSYTIDVYRGEAKARKNPIDVATYIALFPLLIVGPIVRYKTVAGEIDDRIHSADNFSYGIKKFVLGLSKKVLIADALGELSALAIYANQQSLLFYWLGAIAFALQIYFELSGYSDMAIGLGRIFGFHFADNFNYPYISRSITELWTRWYISLGTWFEDYLYAPLGGSKVSKGKWVRNIFIVWLCIGLWHGAGWNFIIWGFFFGIILIIEKLFLKRLIDKIPCVFRHIYVVFLVIISSVIFRGDNIASALTYLKGMFGVSDIPIFNAESIYYLKGYAVILTVAVTGATPVIKNIVEKQSRNKISAKVISILEPICYILLLLIVTGYLMDSSGNSFLYLRF